MFPRLVNSSSYNCNCEYLLPFVALTTFGNSWPGVHPISCLTMTGGGFPTGLWEHLLTEPSLPA